MSYRINSGSFNFSPKVTFKFVTWVSFEFHSRITSMLCAPLHMWWTYKECITGCTVLKAHENVSSCNILSFVFIWLRMFGQSFSWLNLEWFLHVLIWTWSLIQLIIVGFCSIPWSLVVVDACELLSKCFLWNL